MVYCVRVCVEPEVAEDDDRQRPSPFHIIRFSRERPKPPAADETSSNDSVSQ